MKPIVINSQTRRMLMGMRQKMPSEEMKENGMKDNEAKETTKKVVIAKRKGRIYKKVNKK